MICKLFKKNSVFRLKKTMQKIHKLHAFNFLDPSSWQRTIMNDWNTQVRPPIVRKNRGLKLHVANRPQNESLHYTSSSSKQE
jgi:hypothetical protein